MACSALSREQAARLLEVARDNAREVKPGRLGAVGPELFPDRAYGVSSGVASFGAARPQAEIPFVVEAWAIENADMRLLVCVNRTPVIADTYATRDKRKINVFGCGVHRRRSAEGFELRRPAEHHDALHDDHVGQ
jgi:hypothetical protein